MLFLIHAAVAAPINVTAENGDVITRFGSRRVDAWTFAYHYDPMVKRGLSHKIYIRRALLFTTMIGIAGGSLVAAGVVSNRGINPAGAMLIGGGVGLAAMAIPMNFIVKTPQLKSHKHWSFEEASLLAVGRRATPGMAVVPTENGWVVVNRVGRPLDAVEVAAKLGDYGVLRKARRNRVASTVVRTLLLTSGYAMAVGGTGMITWKGESNLFRATGAGTLAAGVAALGLGIVAPIGARGRAPAHYYDREVLERLVEP